MIKKCLHGHILTKDNFFIEKNTGKLRCKKCNVIKSEKSVHKDKISFQKKQKYLKEYLLKNPRSKEKKLESVKKWELKNKDKVKAHKIVKRAIISGLLKRKECEVCGEIKTDAHHPNYNNPLKVMWLCRLHHKEQHRKEKGITNY